MPVAITLLGALVFVVSATLTGLMRRIALSSGLVDVPNSRSSHVRTTPRGGGLAVVIAVLVGVLILAAMDAVSKPLSAALIVGGSAVALVGFLDDRHSVSPVIRFLVHTAAALWALVWLGGLPPLLVGDRAIQLGVFGYLIGIPAVVWGVNLFNFMDGIDGIAASEAIFIAGAGTLLALPTTGGFSVAATSTLVAAACAGFLLWNWPPASIFLGDVGSGFLGYIIVVLAVAVAIQSPVELWVWLILGGIFFSDATVTLVRRTLWGERPHMSHRTHAYQWLARRWNSHRRVTLAVILVDVGWLLPCAIYAERHPARSLMTVGIALAPLVVIALAAGAGRPEPRNLVGDSGRH